MVLWREICFKLLFLSTNLVPSHPRTSVPPKDGVIIGSLKDFATTTHYHQLASKDHDAVTNLNTMLAQDGLYVYVPKGVVGPYRSSTS